MSLNHVTLDDKYRLKTGVIYLTGSQALIRLAMNQIWRDEVAGHNTSAYITGYRGSPMHNIDKELWRATKELEAHKVFFHSAINEDLAATACWGAQQATMYPGRQVRRGCRHLVRQGAGARPLHRCNPARELGRHRKARRCAGGRR